VTAELRTSPSALTDEVKLTVEGYEVGQGSMVRDA
jgi:hypothetical protein